MSKIGNLEYIRRREKGKVEEFSAVKGIRGRGGKCIAESQDEIRQDQLRKAIESTAEKGNVYILKEKNYDCN